MPGERPEGHANIELRQGRGGWEAGAPPDVSNFFKSIPEKSNSWICRVLSACLGFSKFITFFVKSRMRIFPKISHGTFVERSVIEND